MFKVKDGLWQLLTVFFALIATFLQIKLSTIYLSTEELGILALASTALYLSIVLVDFGVGNYIVQKNKISKDEAAALFGLSIGISFFVMIFLGLLGKVIAYIYSQPIVFEITLVSLFTILLTSVNIVPYHLLLSKQKYSSISKSDIVWKVVFSLSIFILFENNFGLYSIPLGQSLGLITKLLLLLAFTNKENLTFNVKKSLDIKEAKDALPYGFSQIGSQLLNSLSLKIDEFFVGKFISLEALGVYSVLKQILMASLGLMAVPVRKLFMPIFSLEKNNALLFLKAYKFYLLILICCISVPVAFPDTVLYILTDFENSGYAFAILSIAWLLRTSSGNIQCAFSVSSGKPIKELTWNAILLIETLFFMVFVYPHLTNIDQLALANLTLSIIVLLSSFIYFRFLKGMRAKLLLYNFLILLILLFVLYSNSINIFVNLAFITIIFLHSAINATKIIKRRD